ncbi:GNAT family N-acetyltransferase [Flavobacterium branchiophilum]|uniref:N-acetyltransferase n=2 Tax=Flavobacterium branchiophilum TaxID=55197 RepID=A0A2H3KEZ7_9FLAO|nr:GNAT family N-acetyltransferase [Flavobacterium branchiophilum]PDS26982.1 N-acetyltransferase [Flavobacterium branchiophilum]CCB68249.1 Probable acetyltransferase, GNAT family [Flavobacterium branchiophilum FL-15]
MTIQELTTIDEMLEQFELIQLLYPKMNRTTYREHLQAMLPNGYSQIALFDNQTCLGLTGCWFSTKLWTGKYLEIDNFIVHPASRSLGVGKKIIAFVEQKAKELNCNFIVLDAFTGNFAAHKFYYNHGYHPRGFHFVKIFDEKLIH